MQTRYASSPCHDVPESIHSTAQVIKLDPFSPRGYEMRRAALRGDLEEVHHNAAMRSNAFLESTERSDNANVSLRKRIMSKTQ